MAHQHHVLRHLQTVLAALDAGPGATELAAAPLLENWRPFSTLDGGTLLAGYVSDHPALREGPIRTSGLLALDPDAGWARTVSRWYRLGSGQLAETPDAAHIGPDNLTMALLIDGLQPLSVTETQQLIAGIRLRLRRICQYATGSD